MAGMLFTMLAVLLAGTGARDQVMMAHLCAAQGGRQMLLLTGIATAGAAAAVAAWASLAFSAQMVPEARLVLAAMALALAGGESLVFGPRPKPAEPTHSLGALAIVLFANQLTDAARFLVFAIAVSTAAPLSAGIGGAAGGAIVMALGWALPERADDKRLRQVRRAIGVLLLVIAGIVVLQALT